MSHSVYKFELHLIPRQTLELPINFEVLRIEYQRGIICLWARVDTNADSTPVDIAIVGTGHPAPPPNEALFLGTVLQNGGEFVWHIFQKIKRID